MFKKNCYFFEDTTTTRVQEGIFIRAVFLPLSHQKPSTGVTSVDLRLRTLVLHDLRRAVQRAFVLVRLETLSERRSTGQEPCQQGEPGRPRHNTHLHSGLDDVEGGVPEHAGGASDGSERAGYHGVDGFVVVVPLVIHKKKSF